MIWPKPRMDDRARVAAPGRFATLSGGLVHYRWQGPDGGPVCVCIHGLTTPGFVWDRVAPALAEAGFRVLVYDLYGRGFSDRPRGKQDRGFFIRQLDELLADQGVAGPVTLFGYSMGGSIATVFAARHPERVDRLLLLAPAGMVHAPGRLSEIARRVPLLGDALFYAFAGRHLRGLARDMGGAHPDLAPYAERQALETRWRGYLPAVLSSQRHILAERLEADHREIARRGIPVGAIWGAADTVIPLAAKDVLAEWNPQARHEVIAGAGHALGLTHSVAVIDALARLLRT